MKWTLLALLVMNCGGAGGNAVEPDPTHTEAPSAGEPARHDHGGVGPADSRIEAPKRSTTGLEVRNLELKFDLTLSRSGSPSGIESGSWGVYDERRQTVLTVKENAIEQLEVVFAKRKATALFGADDAFVTGGKTYVVRAEPADPRVTSAEGQEIPAAEAKAVLAEYGWIGKANELVALVYPGDGIDSRDVGSTVEPSVEARRLLIGEIHGVDHQQTKMKLTLAGDDRKTVRYDIVATTSLEAGGMSFELELKGPALVDVPTGWVQSVDLSGKVKAKGKVQVKVKGKNESFDADGTGSVRIRRNLEFR